MARGRARAGAALFIRRTARRTADEEALLRALAGRHAGRARHEQDRPCGHAGGLARPSGATRTSACPPRRATGSTRCARWLLQTAGWQPHGEGLFMARERHLMALRERREHLARAARQTQAFELYAEELRLAQASPGPDHGRSHRRRPAGRDLQPLLHRKVRFHVERLLAMLLLPCPAVAGAGRGRGGALSRVPGIELVGAALPPDGRRPLSRHRAHAWLQRHVAPRRPGAHGGTTTPGPSTGAERGYVALLVDSFGPRGEREICTQKRAAPSPPGRDRPQDAYASLAWLAAPQGRGSATGPPAWAGRTAGMAVLQHRQGRRARAGRQDGPEFRSAVAFYPGCAVLVRSPTTGLGCPLLIQSGAARRLDAGAAIARRWSRSAQGPRRRRWRSTSTRMPTMPSTA